jgi:hypothetical protein
MSGQDHAPSIVPGDHLLQEIIAHLGAALMQVDPTDDPIIVGHVRTAHSLATALSHVPRGGFGEVQ